MGIELTSPKGDMRSAHHAVSLGMLVAPEQSMRVGTVVTTTVPPRLLGRTPSGNNDPKIAVVHTLV